MIGVKARHVYDHRLALSMAIHSGTVTVAAATAAAEIMTTTTRGYRQIAAGDISVS